MTDKIPFDVELWKTGKYDVVTREGRKVLSLLIHEVNCSYPISIVLEGNCHAHRCIDGKDQIDCQTNGDLFLIPKKRKVFIAVAKEEYQPLLNGGAAQLTEYQAKLFPTDQYHIIEVELPHE